MLDADLAWRGIRASNPWWETRQVPPRWTRPFKRAAFPELLSALRGADVGRGVVLLGPRRVGKTVLLHQIAEALLAEGVAPERIVHLSLDDVALRGADLGELLDLVVLRSPLPDPEETRFLLLDEVQHAPQWSGWLKRIADRRDPYRFLATGSSATALRHGGQDAGLGRWREMVLYPWSFREHVQYRHQGHEIPREFRVFDLFHDLFARIFTDPSSDPPSGLQGDAREWALQVQASLVDLDPSRPNEDLLDYLVRGGFPEVLEEQDWREAQRHLRKDILDRALGRDIADVERVDSTALERMFLRVCKDPGGLWNTSQVASDLGLTRPTVARYLQLLERAFLVFSFPNLASPIKGLPKVYLVAPAMRAALFGLDHERMREPAEWGPATENLVAATLLATRDASVQVGFWREGGVECDAVALSAGRDGELIEVKSGRERDAARGVEAAARALHAEGRGLVLTRDQLSAEVAWTRDPRIPLRTLPVALWLYAQRGAHGGTLRVRT